MIGWSPSVKVGVPMRAWFSGRTGPCQGSDGSPILPARTPKYFIRAISLLPW